MGMIVPQGHFYLEREPEPTNSELRAWDAADEYILNHVAEHSVGLGGHTVVVNDGFGALAVALAEHAPIIWTDLVSSQKAITANLARNSVSGPTFLTGDQNPTAPVDVALIKIPKHNSLLEDQLHRIRPMLTPTSVVIAGGMAKHIHTSTLELFEKIIGPTTTSLAKKKARLAFIRFDSELEPGANPWPLRWSHDGITCVNHGGVFSARSLDIGTRMLLDHLPHSVSDDCRAVDLGCGNGIVGATFLQRNPQAECLFLDESFAAVRSASETIAASLTHTKAKFVVTDSLSEAVEPASVDLVVNNPPFHAAAALSTSSANQMFRASHHALRAEGQLLVVANRHLGYHIRLKRLFKNCETVASNAKFVLLRAKR